MSGGIDCSCCGDRWSRLVDVIDLDHINKVGYSVEVWCEGSVDVRDDYEKQYGKYQIHTNPEISSYGSYRGAIKFNDIEQYAQFLATEYRSTNPDDLDGTVSEF